MISENDHTIAIEFRHPDYPPALNGDKGLIRMHWTKFKKVKEKFYWLIRDQINADYKIIGKASIKIINYYIKPMDWDNLVSRLKIPADVLVTMGIIMDDNPEILDLDKPEQIRVHKRKDVRLVFKIKQV